MDHITIVVNGAVVYDSELQIARTPLPEPKPDNPYVAYLAQYGNDLWAVEQGANITIDAEGYKQALAAGFTRNPAFESASPARQGSAPAFDPYKTVLDSSDIGGLFEPRFGMTTYTITGLLRVFLVIDGAEVLTEKASLSVDGGPPQDATVNGTQARIGEGSHRVVVQHNVSTGRVRLQVQQA
jgi:hypothetical protein